MKTTQPQEDADFDDILQEENEPDEIDLLDAEDKLPKQAKRKPSEVVQVGARPAPAAPQQREARQQQAQPVPAPKIIPKASGRFTAFRQPERTGVAHTETNEILVEEMPAWAAQMFAIIKNDLQEIKEAIGNI